MDARKLAIPQWEGQGSPGQSQTWPRRALGLGPVDILVCLWVFHTFLLKFPSSFFYSWLSRVPWSPIGLDRWHSGLLEWASLTWAVGQPLGSVGFSPSPNSLSLRAQRASCCSPPGWAPQSPPLLPGLGLPQQALHHPKRPAALASPPEVVPPLPQVGAALGRVWAVLWGLQGWAECPFLQGHRGLHRGECGSDPRWLRGCRARGPLCDAC